MKKNLYLYCEKSKYRANNYLNKQQLHAISNKSEE